MTWCAQCQADVGSSCEHAAPGSRSDELIELPTVPPDESFWEPVPGEAEQAPGPSPDSSLDLPSWDDVHDDHLPRPVLELPDRPLDLSLDLPAPTSDPGPKSPEPILDLPSRHLDRSEHEHGLGTPALDLTLPEIEKARPEPVLQLDLPEPAPTSVLPPAVMSLDLDRRAEPPVEADLDLEVDAWAVQDDDGSQLRQLVAEASAPRRTSTPTPDLTVDVPRKRVARGSSGDTPTRVSPMRPIAPAGAGWKRAVTGRRPKVIATTAAVAVAAAVVSVAVITGGGSSDGPSRVVSAPGPVPSPVTTTRAPAVVLPPPPPTDTAAPAGDEGDAPGAAPAGAGSPARTIRMVPGGSGAAPSGGQGSSGPAASSGGEPSPPAADAPNNQRPPINLPPYTPPPAPPPAVNPPVVTPPQPPPPPPAEPPSRADVCRNVPSERMADCLDAIG